MGFGPYFPHGNASRSEIKSRRVVFLRKNRLLCISVAGLIRLGYFGRIDAM